MHKRTLRSPEKDTYENTGIELSYALCMSVKWGSLESLLNPFYLSP